MYDRSGTAAPASGLSPRPSVFDDNRIPVTAGRGPIILSGCSRLERLRYGAEQLILDWRDAPPERRPAHLLQVRDAQLKISRAKYRNSHLAGEMSARGWVDNWEPARG